MNALELLIVAGGVIHFGILLASAAVPRVLEWRAALAGLEPLTRHLVWVHGAYIVLTIVAMGSVSLLLPHDLVARNPLATAVCGFIAVSWGVRLVIQLAVFDARPYLTNARRTLGYHGLTLVFAYLTAVYAYAAIAPGLGTW